MAVVLPDARSRWRCSRCGNLTRFDVVRSSRVREFWHLDLGGEAAVEETEVVSEAVESVSCRWCGADGDAVEVVPRPEAGGPSEDPTADAG
ncbi:MAG: hypothetical protein GC157_09190 [Frankiales bacterium]|nr:hypothetical protein [Frankiales bacterium]